MYIIGKDSVLPVQKVPEPFIQDEAMRPGTTKRRQEREFWINEWINEFEFFPRKLLQRHIQIVLKWASGGSFDAAFV